MSILEITSTVTPHHQRTEQFRSIYDSTYADIEAYCRRRLDPAATADAVSEVFLTAWRRLDDVPADNAARLWLFGVARHVVANQQRSAGRQNRLHLRLIDEPSSQTPGADASIDAPPVVEALATLSDDDAEVLRLVAWEELSHSDAGVVLDCSANAVGVRVHRARQRLADALQDITKQSTTTEHPNELNHD